MQADIFFTNELKRLEGEHMTYAEARRRAVEATFRAYGVHIGTSGATITAAKQQAQKQEDAAKQQQASLKAIETNIAATKTSLATATQTLATAEQNLADTIKQGNQQITDSIRSAESNLLSIGDSLASTIDQFLQKVGIGAGIATPRSAEFQRLRRAIESGTAAPGAARAASELASQIQESQAVSAQTATSTKQRVADLVTQFNMGAISIATFHKRVAALLASEGISYKRAGQVLGINFAEGYKAEVQGLFDQAAAIQAVPEARRRGITGLEPNIVRPMDTIANVQRQIAAAQKARDDARIQVQKDTRQLEREQHQLQRTMVRQGGTANTHLAHIQANTKKTADSNAATDRFLRKLSREQKREASRGAQKIAAAVSREAHAAIAIGGP
jgi:predicted  nucleic acid-binding Zn-ribbon protein